MVGAINDNSYLSGMQRIPRRLVCVLAQIGFLVDNRGYHRDEPEVVNVQ